MHGTKDNRFILSQKYIYIYFFFGCWEINYGILINSSKELWNLALDFMLIFLLWKQHLVLQYQLVEHDTIAKPMVWIPRPLGLTDSKCINLKCKCHFLWIKKKYIYICAMNTCSFSLFSCVCYEWVKSTWIQTFSVVHVETFTNSISGTLPT